jgi:hypothetical protein
MSRLFSPAQLQQLGIDTTTVLAPKMPFVRSKAQLFEEIFLEVVEDLAFYLTVPLVAPLLAKKLFAKPLGTTEDAIGTRLGRKAMQAPKQLIAAKAGTLLGALAVASAFEYMIQPVKAAITAKKFKIKNFTAVAGLEEGRTQLKEGESDPILKAKRRGWQTALVTAVALLGAAFAPKAILRNEKLLAAARKAIKYVDFDSRENTFGLSRSLLALVIGSGVASYLDAARDSLERKETATRLLFVVPGLLFGKALANDLLAWGFEHFGRVKGKTVRKHLEGTGLSFTKGNPLKKAFNADTFLDFDVMVDKADFYNRLKKSGLPDSIQLGIIQKLARIDFPWSYLVSAGIFGSGVCWLAFRQTRQRYQQQQAQATQVQNHVQPFQARDSFSPLKMNGKAI